MSDKIQKNKGGGDEEVTKERPNSFKDEGDVRGHSSSSTTRPIANMPVKKYETHYNMDHKRRGIALIFNHKEFDSHLRQPTRTGTNVDSHKLKKVLHDLGFKIAVFTDLEGEEVQRCLRETAAMDHSDNDCVLIVMLTHGDLGVLYAKDTYYKTENLWHWFMSDKCPTLAGKPKLFFIQACRGEEFDGGITMTSRIETDGLPNLSYSMMHPDFLIMYSTVPGYFSWRNPTNGSWFIQALCEELELEFAATKRDILTLLTFVNQKVALNYESYTPKSSSSHQQKQIPCITSMLTRLLIFEKK